MSELNLRMGTIESEQRRIEPMKIKGVFAKKIFTSDISFHSVIGSFMHFSKHKFLIVFLIMSITSNNEQ